VVWPWEARRWGTLGQALVYGYAFYDRQYGDTDRDGVDEGRADPESLPVNWLSQVTAFAGGKPLAVTETGWIAQDWAPPLVGSYLVTSTPQRQSRYTQMLLEGAADLNLKFVLWFTVADFDPMWSTFPEDVKPPGSAWVHTGLWDIDAVDFATYSARGCVLSSRPGWSVWSEWLSRPWVSN